MAFIRRLVDLEEMLFETKVSDLEIFQSQWLKSRFRNASCARQKEATVALSKHG